MSAGLGGTEPNEYLIGVWGGRGLRMTTQDEQAKLSSEQPGGNSGRPAKCMVHASPALRRGSGTGKGTLVIGLQARKLKL